MEIFIYDHLTWVFRGTCSWLATPSDEGSLTWKDVLSNTKGWVMVKRTDKHAYLLINTGATDDCLQC